MLFVNMDFGATDTDPLHQNPIKIPSYMFGLSI